MKFLASLTLIVSLLVMTVAAAGTAPGRESCSSRLQAEMMCYPEALPGVNANPVGKGGICCDVATQPPPSLPGPATDAREDGFTIRPAASGKPVSHRLWRPPRI